MSEYPVKVHLEYNDINNDFSKEYQAVIEKCVHTKYKPYATKISVEKLIQNVNPYVT